MPAYIASLRAAEAPTRRRVKRSDCHECALDSQCSGVCGEHARTMGLGERIPI